MNQSIRSDMRDYNILQYTKPFGLSLKDGAPPVPVNLLTTTTTMTDTRLTSFTRLNLKKSNDNYFFTSPSSAAYYHKINIKPIVTDLNMNE